MIIDLSAVNIADHRRLFVLVSYSVSQEAFYVKFDAL